MTSRHLKLFSPFGRNDRQTYAVAMPLLVAAGWLLDWLVPAHLPSVISLPLSLLAGWLSFTVLTKRLHDFGLDVLGIYLGAFAVTLLVILAGMFATSSFGADAEPVAVALGLLLPLGWPAFLVWVGFQKGHTHQNQHGAGGSAQKTGVQPTGYLTP